MKGIILAGGSGSRLYPLTSVISKQLLPVYDKPMIAYPLATLMLLGIRDIMIISTERDVPFIQNYLQNGDCLGIKLQYRVQDEPRGIAEAFILAENFIGDESICLILGDNIFNIGDQIHTIQKAIHSNRDALVFGYHVNDPHRFGIIELDGDNNVLSIEEKPEHPKSHYAAVGLYAYGNDVVAKAKALAPSARGELEITDLNNEYLKESRLQAIKLSRGTAWMDAGTPEALLEASQYIGAVEHRQGLKISCLEEVAYRLKYINTANFQNIIDSIKPGTGYRRYLEHVLKES